MAEYRKTEVLKQYSPVNEGVIDRLLNEVGPYGNADKWVNFPSTFSSPPIVIISNAYSSYSRGLAAVDITKTGFNARDSNMGSGTTTFYYSYVAIGK